MQNEGTEPITSKEEGPVVWVTQDGRELRIYQISDRHLVSIIRLLDRRYVDFLSSVYSFAGGLQGEMAQDAALSETEDDTHRYLERIDFFKNEAKSRGIVIK